jgi:hypothetical protein
MAQPALIDGNLINDSRPLATDMTDELGRLLGRVTNYDVLANGTLGELDATVELVGAGLGVAGLGISGTWAGTITVEGNVGDGVWSVIPIIDGTLGSAALTTTVNGNFLIGIAGYLTVRVRMSLYTSGTATVYIEGTSAAAGVFLSRSIPTGINSIGTVGLNAGANLIGSVNIAAAATGGATPYKNIDVDESEDQVKATAATLYSFHAVNMTAAPLFLKLYNATAATVVVGTTVPDMTICCVSDGGVLGTATRHDFGTAGCAFSTALTIAATTGVADNDVGAPGANELLVNLTYS